MPPRPCPPRLARKLRECAFFCATEPAVECDRESYLAHENFRHTHGTITFYPGGSLQTVGPVRSFSWYEGEHKRGDRGVIVEFTNRARMTLIRTVASLCDDGPLLLGTLTYPGQYSTFPAVWKNNLDTWGKRLLRRHPQAAVIWKLEPQDREAPHFHLLIYGVPWIDKAWLARSWYEIAGGGEEEHLKAGTKIEQPIYTDAAMRYACKNYVLKQCDLPHWWIGVGKFWGVIGRKKLPRSREVSFTVPVETLFKYRRLLRKWHESWGRKKPGAGTQSVFGRNHDQWARALAWCEGAPIPSLFLAAVGGHPFRSANPREGRVP